MKEIRKRNFRVILSLWKPKKHFVSFILAWLLIYAPTSSAYPEFRWNGFATLGVSQIDDDTVLSQGAIPYGTHSESLSEESDTLFALQGTLQFSERLSAIVQMLSKATNDYEVEPEWAYLSFQANENIKLRVGRLRRPLFIYSDFFNVGYAYSWVRPPSTTYFDFGPFYNAIDSIDLYFQKTYYDWNLSGQLYYGSDSGRGELFGEELTYDESAAYGASVSLENELLSFRLGYHHSRFSLTVPKLEEAANSLDQLGFSQLGEPMRIDDKLASFISLGAFFTKNEWTLGAETTRIEPKNTILPGVNAWYITAGRSLGKFSLHYSYGEQKAANSSDPVGPIIEVASTTANSTDPNAPLVAGTLNAIGAGLQETLDSNESYRATNILGLRYEIHESAALKFEYEYLKNQDTKSSGNIFSIGFNVLF